MIFRELSEHEEQAQLIKLFRLMFPQYAKRLFAIPNGGLRNIRVAKKLKAEGVLPGVADLFLMHPSGGYHGLFIEMKQRKKGQQSVSQKEFEKEANEAGFCYLVARGFDQALDMIKKYLDGGIVDGRK